MDIFGVLDYVESVFVNWPWKVKSLAWLSHPGSWVEVERMSVNDPIADMLTRIRNALIAGHTLVAMPNSKMKESIAKILKEEGFVSSYEVVDGERAGYRFLRIRLKYIGQRRHRRSVITGLERVSHPGRRVYTGKRDIPWILSGMGIAILTTPKGVMTGQRARQLGIGGEIICKVW